MRHRALRYLLMGALLVAGAAAAQPQSSNRPQPDQTGDRLLRSAFIAQMDAQFGKIDADRNGRLDRTEIEQFERGKALVEAQARNEALFEELDVNHNGQLSAAEFAKLVGPAPAINAQPMLAREDRNRDGLISLVEHRTATLANFDRLDTDRNGVVTPAEMKAGGITPR